MVVVGSSVVVSISFVLVGSSVEVSVNKEETSVEVSVNEKEETSVEVSAEDKEEDDSIETAVELGVSDDWVSKEEDRSVDSVLTEGKDSDGAVVV